MTPKPFGASKSPYDVRTFSYPTKAYPKQKGGQKYAPEDIEDQNKVGICTAISLTQNARKALGKKFSADFQYLIQKKLYDGNWEEGSSIFNALKAAKGVGLLPAEYWTVTTEADRDLPYDQYIAKLQAVTDKQLGDLMAIASAYKINGYASVPVNRDSLASAIDESKSGILVRFNVGQEWYTDTQGNVTWDKTKLEPLRKPKQIISGHAITECNYDGGSFRVANTWSKDWCDGGTGYHLILQYAPTEAWIPYYNDLPTHMVSQIKSRTSFTGRFLDLLQVGINYLRSFAS